MLPGCVACAFCAFITQTDWERPGMQALMHLTLSSCAVCGDSAVQHGVFHAHERTLAFGAVACAGFRQHGG